MIAFFPASASTIAHPVDLITFALLGVSLAVFLLVFGLIAFFAIRYRKGSPHSRVLHIRSQSFIEFSWSFVTLGVFLVICGWGAFIFIKMHLPPPNSSEITVVGKQWMWKFQHAEGQRELNELHVPLGKPILLTMTSQDVIHSFFVPAFRIKQDVLPGRYTQTWFQATKPGVYHLFCTQYCGTAHAEMRGKIVVLSLPDYQQWLQTGIATTLSGGESMVTRGGRLFTRLGCVSCHGEKAGVRAPDLSDLYGSSVGLSDGRVIRADENYLRESILYPDAKIVQGYQAIMPSYVKQTSEDDVLDLIAYIKSLHGESQ